MSHYVKDSESQKSIARIMKTKVQPLLGKKYSEGAMTFQNPQQKAWSLEVHKI